MRGEERQQRSMLMVLNLEQRVPRDHPLRRIKQLAETVLQLLSPSFDRMYSATGRPSIPPERLLKASLLMALYTVRSERLLCEQLDYNLLFRWFLEMELDEASFDHSSFSANRKRLLARWRASSSGEWWRRRARSSCSPASTSRWTAPCSRTGPRLRASGAKARKRVIG